MWQLFVVVIVQMVSPLFFGYEVSYLCKVFSNPVRPRGGEPQGNAELLLSEVHKRNKARKSKYHIFKVSLVIGLEIKPLSDGWSLNRLFTNGRVTDQGIQGYPSGSFRLGMVFCYVG